MKRLACICLFLAGTVAGVSAATYYVDAARPDDAGDGATWATAKRTIAAALSLSSPERVYVRNGTYYLTVTLTMPSGCQLLGGYEGTTPEPGGRSADPAAACIIDGCASNRVFTVEKCVSGTLIDGFTIRNGKVLPWSSGGGLYFNGSTGAVTRCRILSNYASGGSGLGAGVLANASLVFMTNNVIADNNGGSGNGAAVYAQSGSSIHLVNNTIFNNNLYGDLGSGVYLAGGAHVLKNNIIAANGRYGVYRTSGTVTSLYNDVWGHMISNYYNCAAGEGDFSRNPNLAGGSDYHPRSRAGSWHDGAWTADDDHSPCIDAGDPADDVGGELAENGGRINVGAYGGTPLASKSIGYVPAAAPRYVRPSTDSWTPAWPYTNWTTAADSIQTALNGADGQPVYVKAGVYWITNGPLLMASASLLGGYLGEGTPGDRAVFPAQVCTLDANLKNRVIECRAAAEGTVIDGFTIRRGSINAGGSGLYVVGGTLTVRGNRLVDQVSGYGSGYGAAMAIQSAAVAISNNLIAANTCGNANAGAGVIHTTSGMTLVNNTICNNKSGIKDGGVLQTGGHSVIRNNIVAGNSLYGIRLAGGTADLSCNDAWGNGVSNYVNCAPGTGDISRNPCFVDEIDYRLQSPAGSWHGDMWVNDAMQSPCIDAGDPADAWGAEPDPNGGRINMGAYGGTAFASKSTGVIPVDAPRYVRPATDAWTPSWPYTNWATAAADIQTALDLADGQAVYVKSGAYAITNGYLTMRTAQLLGGYLGEGAPGARAPAPADVCILDAMFKNRVLYCVGCTPGTVVDGFTICNGYYPTTASASGGGLYINGSTVAVCNNKILNNNLKTGGGLFIAGGSIVAVSNNVIAGNVSVGGGGLNGAAFSVGDAPTRAFVVNNTIYTNVAYGIGAGYYQSSGYSFLLNNIIASNTALGTSKDGGIYVAGGTLSNAYNDVWRNSGLGYHGCSAGIGDISTDPLLVGDGDFHLQGRGGSWHDGAWKRDPATSPCVDAGDPAGDYSLEPLPNGKRINMGAYGGTPQASRAAFQKGAVVLIR